MQLARPQTQTFGASCDEMVILSHKSHATIGPLNSVFKAHFHLEVSGQLLLQQTMQTGTMLVEQNPASQSSS